MAPLTRTAVFARFGCLLLCALATGGTMSADSSAASRDVIAPSDPTLAPDDPRDVGQPRDMTNPRAFRRAVRGRARDRVAPEAPVANTRPLRDFTNPPIVSDRPSPNRRLEAPAPPLVESRPQPDRAQTARTAPANSIDATEARVTQTEVAARAIQLAETEPVPLPPPPADPIGDSSRAVDGATPQAPLAVDERRVHTLNKPVRQIALVEPIDEEGMRPADVSGALQPEPRTLVLTGSMFCIAHPVRYLYCFSHNPLYFEDANLERCGITHGCCQPACSAAKFVGQAALWPYSLIVTPPGSCVKTLGDCPTCHDYPCGADLHH